MGRQHIFYILVLCCHHSISKWSLGALWTSALLDGLELVGVIKEDLEKEKPGKVV